MFWSGFRNREGLFAESLRRRSGKFARTPIFLLRQQLAVSVVAADNFFRIAKMALRVMVLR
jgi:hypothetical protein